MRTTTLATSIDSRVQRWLANLREVATRDRRGLALTHDNPDPDAMASAAGLGFLIESLTGRECMLGYGGTIGRAENRELVRLLKIPLIPLHRIDLGERDLLALVDTQPAAGNHSLPDARQPDVVVDHHPRRSGSDDSPVCIVSGDYGATSSIVTELIREAGLEPPPGLATALFYGVKTDTRSLGRESAPADAQAYRWLFERSDPELLARIEHPQVPRAYFQDFHRALARASLYGRVLYVDLGEVHTPEIVPEVADKLVLFQDAKWAVAVGLHDEALFLSVRTDDRRMNAGKRLRQVVEELGGSAGGHGQMAGARLDITDLTFGEVQQLRQELRERILEELGADDEERRPLV